MGFSAGSDPVNAADFSDVLDVLNGGSSAWHEYIVPNLNVAKKSPRSFQVLTVTKFNSKTGYGTDVPGVTYKQTGEIIMQQWGRPDTTYLSAALHECVHLVSHPATQGVAHSTALGPLGLGLLEGLVEVVTEDILLDQKISLASGTKRGHQQRVPVVRELLKTMSVVLFAKTLFQGDDAQLKAVMEATYSTRGWQSIKNITTANQPDMVRRLMTESRARKAEEDNRALEAAMKAITPPATPPSGPH
jgi:hypothetical protein